MTFLSRYFKEGTRFVRTVVSVYGSDSLFLSLPFALSIPVSIITLPIILRNLSIEDYGRFQFVLAVQVWLITLTAGQITLGAQRGIAQGKDGTFLYAFLSRLRFVIP